MKLKFLPFSSLKFFTNSLQMVELFLVVMSCECQNNFGNFRSKRQITFEFVLICKFQKRSQCFSSENFLLLTINDENSDDPIIMRFSKEFFREWTRSSKTCLSSSVLDFNEIFGQKKFPVEKKKIFASIMKKLRLWLHHQSAKPSNFHYFPAIAAISRCFLAEVFCSLREKLDFFCCRCSRNEFSSFKLFGLFFHPSKRSKKVFSKGRKNFQSFFRDTTSGKTRKTREKFQWLL